MSQGGAAVTGGRRSQERLKRQDDALRVLADGSQTSSQGHRIGFIGERYVKGALGIELHLWIAQGEFQKARPDLHPREYLALYERAEFPLPGVGDRGDYVERPVPVYVAEVVEQPERIELYRSVPSIVRLQRLDGIPGRPLPIDVADEAVFTSLRIEIDGRILRARFPEEGLNVALQGIEMCLRTIKPEPMPPGVWEGWRTHER